MSIFTKSSLPIVEAHRNWMFPTLKNTKIFFKKIKLYIDVYC